MARKKVKKNAVKDNIMTADQINHMIEKDELWGMHLSILISQDVCCWFNDNHSFEDGRFRATSVNSIDIIDDKHGHGMLYINFDICVETNDSDEITEMPHFGCWQIRREGMFLEPCLEFLPDGNTEFIMPGSIEIHL